MALNLRALRDLTPQYGNYPLHVSLFSKLMEALTDLPNTDEIPDISRIAAR